ncbi:Protein SET DOMAIN GROUP 41 [Morus notabilis]|uniref:Protein SET DOMAIN GROUP 41 n=1 Tax=Morus notabilis TaxID=981085 RepID=W9S639_9ROSA|nr:Protein SET DOMAIN GROUP 41 [Morus notabilis]
MGEMEMMMRGREEIEMGEDLTRPLPPLSFSLHHSLLLSHCSSCFSPLPSSPLPPIFPPRFPPSNSNPKILYCSSQCSFSDSPLHFSSAEHHLLCLLPSAAAADSSDLRAALRLLESNPATRRSSSVSRIAGLSTNLHKLANDDEEEVAARIRDGARAMAAARRMRDRDCSGEESEGEEEAMAAAALCAVLTNGVEVQVKSGRTLGVAVYGGGGFSWINHSCSPNACYRISLHSDLQTTSFLPDHETAAMRIVPCCNKETQCGCSYGPRIIVRSIKRIQKGEEVTVAYTDLLQPKSVRQSDLWSKYRFICCCSRCGSVPPTYMDRVLEEISVVNGNSSSSDSGFYRDKATQMLTQYIDDAISDYLSIGDAQSCCEKLDHVLTRGLPDEQLERNEGTSLPTYTYWLHPLHHLSLNAYTTLASAYKTCSNDMLALFSEANENLCVAFDMSRTSVAYSLLLAGATNHLFQFEPSLIASVANYWVSAGESLSTFARSSMWRELIPLSSLSSIIRHNCLKCSLGNKYETGSFHSQVQYEDFAHVSSKFLDCVTDYMQKVWHLLVHGCNHLRVFKDPLDFSWLVTAKYSSMWEICSHCSSNNIGSNSDIYENIPLCEAQGCTTQVRIHLFQLGVHCLLYGAYLSSICFGKHSYLTCHAQNILDTVEHD